MKTPKRHLVTPVASLLAVVAISLLAAIGLWWEKQSREVLRVEVTRSFCLQIESIKTHLRSEAEENYEDLDRTLKLLNLERTPEIERAAEESRDSVVLRFAPSPISCAKKASLVE